MDIRQMHNVFRTIGQQNGIQQIRGILPESIDVFLNAAIIEKVRRTLFEGVAINNKNSVADNGSTMSLINVFGNLYKQKEFIVENEDIIEFYNPSNSYSKFKIPITDYMKILNISVLYNPKEFGNAINCRIINADELYDTLHDYCNSASKQYPIACIINNNIEIYINEENVNIKILNIDYIKNPVTVKFDIANENNVNCDLPDYTHYEIVELAVQKFYNSVGVIQPNQARQ